MTDVSLANCTILRPPVMGGRVEVVLAEPAVRCFPSHLSEALGVCVKYGGAHDVVADGRRRRYPAESVSVRAPGCVWASEEGRYGFVSIDVAPALLPPDWAGAGMGFAGTRELPGVAQAARRLITAREALEADEALTGLLAAVLATRTLASDVARDDPGPSRALAAAREFLHDRHAARPTLEALAQATGVSKFTLLRRFRRRLGTTPHAYLVMVRVSRAQELLAAGASPAEAAAAVGFSDQSHLGLWFRRLLGVTPAAYRRQVRAAISLQTQASRLGKGARA